MAAIRGLRDADEVVVVGGGAAGAVYPADAAGTLAPWGVDVRVGEGTAVLPLSLTVGRWLLDRAGVGRPDEYRAVAVDAGPEECLAIGAELAERASRVALLVMADGSAALTVKAPGYLQPGAEDYDRALVRALAAADVTALGALDPAEADELWVGGRAALQVLAGAGRKDTFQAEVLYDEAPYGVGYHVVSWHR
ncbi:hypothetical protein [Sphaerisporangium rubeum]|uniref:Uncharacterized protein n=1 Tax=Sphaerisporangium rubeum TaxID=321317 RepID=A0A7X0M809_9ACTN|nr:uncharacterized protein [Sphaerisporangium rubeum]